MLEKMWYTEERRRHSSLMYGLTIMFSSADAHCTIAGELDNALYEFNALQRKENTRKVDFCVICNSAFWICISIFSIRF